MNNEHTWLRVEGDNLGTLGITHYAQEQLKEVVFVKLPEVGTKVAHMEAFGIVESVKATNDLFSPVSGGGGGVESRLRGRANLGKPGPLWKRLDDSDQNEQS